jgi:hypothetical protein
LTIIYFILFAKILTLHSLFIKSEISMLKTIRLIIGVITIIGGLMGFSSSFFGGISFILAGLFIVPQTGKFINNLLEKPIKAWLGIFLTLTLLLIGTIFLTVGSDQNNQEEKKIAEYEALPQYKKDSIEIAKAKIDSTNQVLEKIDSHFSILDGHHKELEKVVIAAMNDEDSYEHIKTTRIITGENRMLVKMTYSGKNAFGGTVKNTVSADIDFNGNILKIIE